MNADHQQARPAAAAAAAAADADASVASSSTGEPDSKRQRTQSSDALGRLIDTLLSVDGDDGDDDAAADSSLLELDKDGADDVLWCIDYTTGTDLGRIRQAAGANRTITRLHIDCLSLPHYPVLDCLCCLPDLHEIVCENCPHLTAARILKNTQHAPVQKVRLRFGGYVRYDPNSKFYPPYTEREVTPDGTTINFQFHRSLRELHLK